MSRAADAVLNPPRLISIVDAARSSTVESGDTTIDFVEVNDVSRWFDVLGVARLAAGNSDGPRFYPEDDDDAVRETWCIITSGRGGLTAPDGTVVELEKFDAVYFPPGSGAELSALDTDLTFLVVGSGGTNSSAYDRSADFGAGLRTSQPRGSNPIWFKRRNLGPRQWPANELGATAKPWWFYTVDDQSRWFHSACVSSIAPGGASTFHSHMERFEGPYETWYIVLQGQALIRNEYEDFIIDSAPGGVFVPSDASHQMINSGDEFLWYLTLSSRGDSALRLDTYETPSGVDRPGYADEYARILRVRESLGLPTP